MSRADSIKKEFRYELMEKIANDWLDCADMKTLEEYFFNAQMEYLDELDVDNLHRKPDPPLSRSTERHSYRVGVLGPCEKG